MQSLISMCDSHVACSSRACVDRERTTGGGGPAAARAIQRRCRYSPDRPRSALALVREVIYMELRGRRPRIDSVCPALTARLFPLGSSIPPPYRALFCGACLCVSPLGVGWCRHFGVGVAMILSGPRLSGFDSALCVRSRRKRGVGPGNGYALPGHYRGGS